MALADPSGSTYSATTMARAKLTAIFPMRIMWINMGESYGTISKSKNIFTYHSNKIDKHKTAANNQYVSLLEVG